MTTTHFRHIPLGVLLIAAFYMFGAFVLLISIFNRSIGIQRRFGKQFIITQGKGGMVYPFKGPRSGNDPPLSINIHERMQICITNHSQ